MLIHIVEGSNIDKVMTCIVSILEQQKIGAKNCGTEIFCMLMKCTKKRIPMLFVKALSWYICIIYFVISVYSKTSLTCFYFAVTRLIYFQHSDLKLSGEVSSCYHILTIILHLLSLATLMPKPQF